MQAAATIRSARRSAKLTQQQLAERAGVPQSVIARLERAGSNPTLATFDRVLRATGHELRAVEAGREPGTLDLDQLRRRLAMSPAQRLETFRKSHENLYALTARARRVD